MKKIIIIGCPGSGKSTLSKKLSLKTGLPLFHLDILGWKENWAVTPKEEFDRHLKEILKKDRWIIDGNYNRTIGMRLEVCDTVIWLDYPRWVCLMGVVCRFLRFCGKNRDDMGSGCKEKLSFEFLKGVWNFNDKNRDKYKDMLGKIQNSKTVIILKNRKEAEKFLKNL